MGNRTFSHSKKRRASLKRLMSPVTSKVLVSKIITITSVETFFFFFWWGASDQFGYQFSGETEAHSCNLSCHKLFIRDIAVAKSLNLTISRLVLYLSGNNISPGSTTQLVRISYGEEPPSDQFRDLSYSQSKSIYFFPPLMWFLVLSSSFLWKRLKGPPASPVTQSFSEEVTKNKPG